MDQLPKKWKRHIELMCKYHSKSNYMRQELEEYFESKGIVGDLETHQTSPFEDAIIDSMLSGEGQWLIDHIESELKV